LHRKEVFTNHASTRRLSFRTDGEGMAMPTIVARSDSSDCSKRGAAFQHLRLVALFDKRVL
jgi:hypothetical protein